MEKKTSHIRELDAQVEGIKESYTKRPQRVESDYPPEFPDHPARAATSDQSAALLDPVDVDVVIVGAGWAFAWVANAVTAAGRSWMAYDANSLKIGKGQVGLTGEDDYLELGQHNEAIVFPPNLTPEQLDKLGLTVIAQLPSVKALTKKWEIADSIAMEATESKAWKAGAAKYKALDKDLRMPKREVVDMKAAVIEAGKYGEKVKKGETAGIDLLSARLNSNKAVFMASGRVKMRIPSLEGFAGYVPELLLQDPQSKAAFAIMASRQQRGKNIKAVILGSGDSARGAVLEILKRVDPARLEVVIAPLPRARDRSQSLAAARREVDFQLKTGYVTELLVFEDKAKMIKGIKMDNVETEESEEIKIGIFVHSADETFPWSRRLAPYEEACRRITNSLSAKPAENAFLRCKGIVPDGEDREIGLRIKTEFSFSLRDDVSLRKAITDLVRNENPDVVPTILITGDNLMTKCVILLITELVTAEQGKSDISPRQIKVIQVAAPSYSPDQPQHSELDRMLEDVQTKTVPGRLTAEGTEYRKEKGFHLKVQKSGGESINIDDVHVVFNAAGGTYITPEVQAMIDRGYITERVDSNGISRLYSNRPKLAGWGKFFDDAEDDDEDEISSPTYIQPVIPEVHRRIRPDGWDPAYKFFCSLGAESA
jgi:hypothetical protein